MATTHIPLRGGAYQSHSVIAAAQRCLNLYPETGPTTSNAASSGQTVSNIGEPSIVAHYPTPGTRLLGTIGTGPIRGIRQCSTGSVYVVSGDTLYLVNVTDWTGTPLGTLTPGIRTPVSMTDNTLTLVVVDGSANGWTVTLADNTFAQIYDPNGLFIGADRVDYLDTFFILNKPGTPQFYISGSMAVTFDSLDFANKAAYSDLLMTAVVCKRLVYLVGERTTEIWYESGETFSTTAGQSASISEATAVVAFQFAPMQSEVFVDHGTVAKYSPAVYDNYMFWLTRDRQGQGAVHAIAGYESKRISTFAIEQEIAGYDRISDAIGFCYRLGGHAYYVLTFPHADKTWAYDIITGLWHEWGWIDTNGSEHRHRANCFCAVNDLGVIGDWQHGNLYALDHRLYTDDGRPIKRVRAFPHLLSDGKRVFYRQFLADFETGNEVPPSEVTTSTERIITWLPNIAQLTGISVGAIGVTTGGVYIDWPRELVYIVGQTGYQKYTTALETQTALVTVATPGTRFVWGGDIDPLSGCLIIQTDPGNPNGVPIYKLDPTTFAVLDTFGAVVVGGPTYPTSVWGGQSIVCVVASGVSFGFLKYSAFSGIIAGFRVDTMEHSGFIADIVSGSTNNRGSMCAGASGGTAASVFLSWDATTTIAPAVPLYRVDIAASATTYNPATWPATNPGITWTTVGTVAVSAVEPAWTGFTVESLGYDQADGNVLMLVGTQNTAQGYHILKLSAVNATVMWNIAIGTAIVDLAGSRINGSLWMFRNVGAGAGASSSYRINTLTGTMETLPISGVFAAGGGRAGQQSDSETSVMLFGGNFNVGASAPIPVEGTGAFSNGWCFMGGQNVRTIITSTQWNDNLISLDWSDDRGHSFGSPVTQPIGATGEYRTSLQWQRLGMARDRVFRISWSVPVRAALQGCWLDATPAQS